MALARSRITETTILARLFGDKLGQLPPEMARYILDLDFNDDDKVRLHELVVRNQDDGLSPAEKGELTAFLNAGSMLSILQARAPSRLGVKAEDLTLS